MHYFIGDIHGHLGRLTSLFEKLSPRLTGRDTIVFLGDYIDRGPHSFDVVDFMIHLSRRDEFRCVFLKGNHEDMFMEFLAGRERGDSFMLNGGDATIRSYRTRGDRFEVPERHLAFYRSLLPYHEGEDFIAVHAGLNPNINTMEAQSENDLLWIRDRFFRAKRRWDKTVIFGHTPVPYLERGEAVYFDAERNIIGIDSGVIFGRPIACLSWPDREIISG